MLHVVLCCCVVYAVGVVSALDTLPAAGAILQPAALAAASTHLANGGWEGEYSCQLAAED